MLPLREGHLCSANQINVNDWIWDLSFALAGEERKPITHITFADLTGAASIRMQVAVPRTDVNEHCSKINGQIIYSTLVPMTSGLQCDYIPTQDSLVISVFCGIF